MSRAARIAVAWLAAPALGALGISFHYGRYGYDQCHPARVRVTSAERDEARRTLPALEEVSFAGDGGVTLKGWLTPPKNGNLVVLVHGLGGNRASLLPEAEILARHGYGSLLFDSRAHGESGGDTATWGEREWRDVRAAIAFALERNGVARVALLGFSVGAAAVTRAAAEDPRVHAIILYATWTSLREENAYKTRKYGGIGRVPALWGYLWSGVDVDTVFPIDDVPRFTPRPLLMIAAMDDLDTPPWVMDRLFAAAGEPKEIWHEPGVGHGGCVAGAPEEYERRVIGFLSRGLAP
jgi:pimeloyl-ACP methyl ester carboxylesterase